MLGLVCERCDSYNDPGASHCIVCGAALGFDAPGGPQSAVPGPIDSASQGAPPPTGPAGLLSSENQRSAPSDATPALDWAAELDELPQQDKGLTGPAPRAQDTLEAPAPRTCTTCQAPLGAADRFCASCGAHLAGAAPAPAPEPPAAPGAARTQRTAAQPLPADRTSPEGATQMMPSSLAALAPEGAPSATQFFGAATVERFARLILVKGHTQMGTQWRLQGGETLVGRDQGLVLFPEDPYLSARHCRLQLRGDELWLVPEDTPNGVFIRIQGRTPLGPGDELAVGMQRLRVLSPHDRAQVLPPRDGDTPLLGSLVHQDPPIRLARVAGEEALDEVYCRPQRLLSIGRSQCDLAFPNDPYLSTRHAQLTREGETLVAEDLQSRNGTFVRLRGARRIAHGDMVMLGEQVLRVELGARL